MQEIISKPSLHFHGFDDEWTLCELISLCELFTDGDWIEAKDQSKKGIRLIQTGNVGVATFVDKPNHRKWISEETFDRLHCKEVLPGDILISRLPEPAGRACITPILDTKMITAVDCTIARIDKKSSPDFLVQYLSSDRYFNKVNLALAGGTRQRISRSNLSKVLIPIPQDLAEQEKIGALFKKLDSVITLCQSEHKKLIKVKSSMLEVMFPKDGAEVPEVRFKGFTGAWKKHAVRDLLVERNEQSPKSSEYPLMAFIAYEGVAPKGDRYDRSSLVNDTENKLYKRTEKGDFIYSSNNLETGSIGLNNYGSACISPVYSIFSTTAMSDSDFIGQRFVKKDFINEMVKWRQGVIYGQWRIHEDDFLKIEVLVPSIQEQEKIGKFLRSLDDRIALQKEKLERLQSLKKAFLEKMFV